MLRAGHLNSTIRLERNTATMSAAGKRTPAWATLATLRAEVVRLPVEEIQKEKGKAVKRPVTFRTWFREDVRLEDRIVFGGFAYIVKGFTELGRRWAIEIQTELDGAV